MAKKLDTIFSIFAILFGFLCCFGEIVIRINRYITPVSWCFWYYYLVPVRGHAILWLISLGLVVWLLVSLFRRKKQIALKLAAVLLNALYLVLFFLTSLQA